MVFKRLILIAVLSLLFIQTAFAIGFIPEISISANPTTTTSSTTITSVATDFGDNAGIEWIQLYRDGILFYTRNCNKETVCVLVKVDFETNVATHNYYARTMDKDGNIRTSSTVTVNFIPTNVAWSQATLDLGTTYQGGGDLTSSRNIVSTGANNNVVVSCASGSCTTITDNWIDGTNMATSTSQAVTFTCDDVATGTYSAVFNVVSNEDNIPHQLTVSCIITPPPTNNQPTFTTLPVNTNIQVSSSFSFDVDASDADPLDVLTFSDNAAQFNINSATGLISFTPAVVETISAIITVCDNSGAPNACNTQPFTLVVDPLPPPSIRWNLPTLSLGTGIQGAGDLAGSEDIISTGANNNVAVSCASGSCTTITDNFVDGTNMIDAEAVAVTFTCDDAATGTFSAIFSVVSNEDLTPDQITVGCQINPLTCTDSDSDTYYVEGGLCGTVDCDDTDSSVYPGAAETCDGEDDDCDGTIDEGCECISGRTRSCGISELGLCRYGTQTCVSGSWGSCVGAVFPVLEACFDYLDNDCDGSVDEGCYPPYIYSLYISRGNPQTVSLAVDESVRLDIEGTYIYYTTLKALSPYYIMLNFLPGTVISAIRVSDPTEIDLDKNGRTDLYVTYNGVVENKKASITFDLPPFKSSKIVSTTSKRTAYNPSTSIMSFIEETKEAISSKFPETYKVLQKAKSEAPVAAAALIFLLILVVIIRFTERKWNQWL